MLLRPCVKRILTRRRITPAHLPQACFKLLAESVPSVVGAIEIFSSERFSCHAPLSILLLLGANAALPCYCAGYTEREKFRKASYVFVGQVEEIAYSDVELFIHAMYRFLSRIYPF
jgi:hypothetical protein